MIRCKLCKVWGGKIFLDIIINRGVRHEKFGAKQVVQDMVIGICGADQRVIKETKKVLCQHFPKKDQMEFKEYLPAEVLIDLEEMVFHCDILILSACYQNKNMMVWLGQQLNIERPNCQLIYIVDGIEATPEFYEVRHCYLLHRVQLNDFIELAIDKAMRCIQAIDSGILELVSQGHRIYVRQKEILYIERQDREIKVVTKEKVYTTYESLRSITERVKKPLLRCHAGYIVNLATVENISATSIIGVDGYQIPLGRTYAAEVRREFRQYWMNE